MPPGSQGRPQDGFEVERLELEPVALVKLVLELDPMKAKGVEKALEDIHTLVAVGEWWMNGG